MPSGSARTHHGQNVVKAVCVVAHPDDCIIFAYACMYNFSGLDWHIVYLTHAANSPRGKEIAAFWHKRHISTKFLGFADDPGDNASQHITFDKTLAFDSIRQACQGYDCILTHGEAGEYGHVHHKFIWQCTQDLPNVITFELSRTLTSVGCPLPNSAYDLAEVPLHADIIQLFHPHSARASHVCYYKFPPNLEFCRQLFANYHCGK